MPAVGELKRQIRSGPPTRDGATRADVVEACRAVADTLTDRIKEAEAGVMARIGAAVDEAVSARYDADDVTAKLKDGEAALMAKMGATVEEALAGRWAEARQQAGADAGDEVAALRREVAALREEVRGAVGQALGQLQDLLRQMPVPVVNVAVPEAPPPVVHVEVPRRETTKHILYDELSQPVQVKSVEVDTKEAHDERA
jgi:hypothetical protein